MVCAIARERQCYDVLVVFIARDDGFACAHCGYTVLPLGRGSYRNHCPWCLYSRHVDDEGPGDRNSDCEGLMEPMGLDRDGKKGFVIVHRCVKCRVERKNKAAPDDNLMAMG